MNSTAGASKTRLEPLEPPYSPKIEEMLSSMMPPGVPPLRLFRTLAHNPRVLGKIKAGNLLDRGSLDRKDRELAIMRTCARCGSEYEWGVHVAFFAQRYDIPEEVIAGTLHWAGDDPRWGTKDGAIVRLADELRDTATVSDRLFVELRELFAPEQIVEFLVLIGFYNTIAFVTNGLGIPHEDFAVRFADIPATG